MHNNITMGQLIAFNALLGYFTQPVEAIVNLQNSIQTAKIANMRLNQIFMVPSEQHEEREVRSLKVTQQNGDFNLKDVSFEYKYGQEVIHNINLKIPFGTSLAIVGFSGSGKTTLVKLLVNFYNPTSGEIALGTTKLASIDVTVIRDNVNYLPQKPYIFSASVAENIALGLKGAFSMDKIVWAAKMAEVDADIKHLPDGYNTKISQDSGLSGGQQQRIAIARALLTDAPIMIFDESTSSLDVLTEKKVVENILNMPNKTLIFIAHRLNIAKKVDNILVMEHGEIVESGSHEQLLAQHGEYYQLLEE